MENTLEEIEQLALELARSEATTRELRKRRDTAIAVLYALPRVESATMLQIGRVAGLSVKQVSLIIKRNLHKSEAPDGGPDMYDPNERLAFIHEARQAGVPLSKIAELCDVPFDYVIHCLNHYFGENIQVVTG